MSQIILNIGEFEKLDDKHEMIRTELAGMFGSNEVPALRVWGEKLNRKVVERSKQSGQPVCILIDIQKLEGYNSPEIFQALVDLMKADQPYVYRTGTFGGSANHELIQQVLEGMANRDNLKNFSTEAEAVNWLKEWK